MTILGRGDLSPRRRHHRGRRWPRVLLVLIVLGALGAGGYYGWHRWRNDNASVAAVLPPCPTPTPTPSLAPIADAKVAVLNASLRTGLAKRAAKDLHGRFGVNVVKVANAPQFDNGPSVLRYPPTLAAQSQLLAAMLIPAPRLRAAGDLTRLELDLGTGFRRVATPSEYAQSTATVTSPSPTPTPTATPSPCASP